MTKRFVLTGLLAVLAGPALAGPTLDGVRERGELRCGINSPVPGIALIEPSGKASGFETDMCRAVAAAVLGKAEAVRFEAVTGPSRLPMLKSGDIDLLDAEVTWTLSRDVGLGLRFVGVSLHDGQGFLMRKAGDQTSFLARKDPTICVIDGTTSKPNLMEYLEAQKIVARVVTVSQADTARDALRIERCDVYTNDRSALIGTQSQLPVPGDYVLADEVISHEPLGPVVRNDDPQWFDIVRWTLFALIAAEQQGVTMANVDAKRADGSEETKRLLGVTGGFGKLLGVNDDWAYQVIRQVGNYGEIFARNLGAQSAFKMSRSRNALMRDGGLMYAPPFR